MKLLEGTRHVVGLPKVANNTAFPVKLEFQTHHFFIVLLRNEVQPSMFKDLIGFIQ